MGQLELVLAVSAALAASLAADVPGGFYQTKYDFLDLEDVLGHKRLVHHYAACLLGRGPCPPQGADLKRILPEALETNCLRCTEKQKTIILRTIRRLRREYPSLWKELVDYWDPTGKYGRTFEQSLDGSLQVSNKDETNIVLDNRFSEDSENGLAAPVKPNPTSITYPTVFPSSTTSSTPAVPLMSATVTTTTTIKPPITSITSSSSSTTIATSSTSSTTQTTTTSDQISSTQRGSIFTRWKLKPSSTAEYGPRPYGWRPTNVPLTTQHGFFKPQQGINLPLLKIEAGAKILESITDLSTKVIKAGTEVAGMVLSTVHALVAPKT